MHLPFNFQLIHAPWNACEIDRMIHEYDERVPEEEWPNWVLGNHDQHRIATRVGEPQARVAAMMLLTLHGTPTLYYGDEIGMHDVAIPPHQVHDPYEKNQPGLGLGRDPQRTPMQWDASAQAGFTTGAPWLPVAEDFHRRNVKMLAEDPQSILTLYKRLVALRRSRDALSVGDFTRVSCAGNVMAYQRSHGGERLFVALNFGHDADSAALPTRGATVLLSTHLDREGETLTGRCALRADEGVIALLQD